MGNVEEAYNGKRQGARGMIGRGKRQEKLLLLSPLPIVPHARFYLSSQYPYDTNRPLRRREGFPVALPVLQARASRLTAKVQTTV